MKTPSFSDKTYALLLIAGAVLLLIPYTLLTITFDYPDILRKDTGLILTQFHAGGHALILTWWAFAVVGLPLLPAYVRLGQLLEGRIAWMRWSTVLGVTGLIVQMAGLLRWTFVVPVLSDAYLAGREMERMAAIMVFKAVHQYGGVVLGEHLGQVFTVGWTVAVSGALYRLRIFPVWVPLLGFGAAGIYFLAQAECFATVIPGFPVWSLAGLIGSTLWLVWLVVLGVYWSRKGLAPAE